MESLFDVDTRDWLSQLWFYIGLTPLQALGVLAATVALYCFFLVMTRIVGQRVFVKMTGFDILLTIALSSLVGRAMMGHVPTAGAAILAVCTLLALEGLFGSLSRRPSLFRFINNEPVLLVADGAYLDDELRRTHITEHELQSRIRTAGIRSRQDVAAIILERSGELSVYSKGQLIDAELLAQVRSAARLPEELVRR